MKKQEINYWTLVLLLNYIPTIGFHFFVRPMWYKDAESYTSATSIETLFTIFFLPIFLALTNYFLAKNHSKTTSTFILNGLIIISCVFISTHLHFKNWADSIGNWYNPDNETIAVMDFERISGIIISLVGLSIVFFRLRDKNKIKNWC